jgi:hypothetical protein
MIFAMSIPNLIGVYLLAPVVKRELDTYRGKLRTGEIAPSARGVMEAGATHPSTRALARARATARATARLARPLTAIPLGHPGSQGSKVDRFSALGYRRSREPTAAPHLRSMVVLVARMREPAGPDGRDAVGRRRRRRRSRKPSWPVVELPCTTLP